MMADCELSYVNNSTRLWQFSLAQLLIAVAIISLLLPLGLREGFWGVALGLIVVLSLLLLYRAIRDQSQFSVAQLLISNMFVSLLVSFGFQAGLLGIGIAFVYLVTVLLFYGLRRARRKMLGGILAAVFGANLFTWASQGMSDEAFLLLPYQGAANFNLDFALICGDSARMDQLSERKRREAICSNVKHVYYDGNVGYTFWQIGQFGEWYEKQQQVSQSTGLHFNAETILHAPMFRVVREEVLGRGLFGSGSEVLYVWRFNRWARVYELCRWIS